MGLIRDAEHLIALHGAVDDVDGIAAQDGVDERRGRALPAVDLVLAHVVHELGLLIGRCFGELVAEHALARAVDRASEKVAGRKFAALSAAEQRDFVNNMRQNKIEGWTGPGAGFVYTILRSDAVDVVYGTMEGYAALDIPYQAHIAPTRRW